MSNYSIPKEEYLAMERDAKRYRWLRGRQHLNSEVDFVMVNGYGDLKDEALDAAIDATACWNYAPHENDDSCNNCGRTLVDHA